MCGIAGYCLFDPSKEKRSNLDAALRQLSHRGPDDRGLQHFAGKFGVAGLGHTRLSIIDLSSGGHQPMSTADGQLTLVFNGEIYNYRELRSELCKMGSIFSSESDTEVLLQAWATWGSDCLPKLVGMFAVAILDFKAGTLTLVRDAFGIKPLYFGRAKWGLCFASELPACVTLRAEGAQLDHQRACDYLLHGDYDSNEHTFVEGIDQLPPATLQVVEMATGRVLDHRRWWVPNVVERGRPRFSDAAEQLRSLFLDTVRLHLRSDVPLGAALSGGIDSSAVIYAMRKIEPDVPLHTFSFVAAGSSVSEETWIDAANAGVGAIPHRVIVEPAEMARDIDDLITSQGEPFGSTSIYAQYRVFKLAREAGITVTLEGQGADELLGGYIGYPGQRIQSLLDAGNIVGAWSFLRHWSRWPDRNLTYGVRSAVAQYMTGPLYEALRKLRLRSMSSRIAQLEWIDVDYFRDRGVRFAFPRQLPDPCPSRRRMVAELALSATRRGLPALLRHADRNSMRFSIESRVPFLTPQLASFLLGLPEEYLVSRDGRTKHLFREAMRGIVPDVILDRRDKIGFATPEKEWFRALGNTAKDWIREASEIPFLRPDAMLQRFEAMLNGQLEFSWQAWRWINFCRWHTRVLQPMNG